MHRAGSTTLLIYVKDNMVHLNCEYDLNLVLIMLNMNLCPHFIAELLLTKENTFYPRYKNGFQRPLNYKFQCFITAYKRT